MFEYDIFTAPLRFQKYAAENILQNNVKQLRISD